MEAAPNLTDGEKGEGDKLSYEDMNILKNSVETLDNTNKEKHRKKSIRRQANKILNKCLKIQKNSNNKQVEHDEKDENVGILMNKEKTKLITSPTWR